MYIYNGNMGFVFMGRCGGGVYVESWGDEISGYRERWGVIVYRFRWRTLSMNHYAHREDSKQCSEQYFLYHRVWYNILYRGVACILSIH